MNERFRVEALLRTVILALSLLFLGVGCGRSVHARLHSADGIEEGSPVVVSGVEVGHVREVRLVEGQVDAEFTVDSAHELTVRVDTCAVPGRLADGRGALVVSAGRGAPVSGPASIPPCELDGAQVSDAFRGLGQGMGVVLREVSQGFFEGVSRGAP